MYSAATAIHNIAPDADVVVSEMSLNFFKIYLHKLIDISNK